MKANFTNATVEANSAVKQGHREGPSVGCETEGL